MAYERQHKESFYCEHLSDEVLIIGLSITGSRSLTRPLIGAKYMLNSTVICTEFE